jgi:hypothetical protein
MTINVRDLALTLIVLLSSPSMACSQPPPMNMPKDAKLVELFQSHREAFESLAKMGMEDGGTVSHISVEALKDQPLTGGRQALSPERRNEYVRLLNSIRPDVGIGIDRYGVCFSCWDSGTSLSVGRTSEKGIAFLPHGYETVGKLVNSLDQLPTQDDMYLVRIEPDWYIYYSQSD